MKLNAVNNKAGGYLLSVSGLSLRLAFGSFFSFFYPHPSSPFIFPLINQCDRCLVPLAWGLMVGRRGFTRG